MLEDDIILDMIRNEDVKFYGAIAVGDTVRWSCLYKDTYDFVIEVKDIDKEIKTYTFIGKEKSTNKQVKNSTELKETIQSILA